MLHGPVAGNTSRLSSHASPRQGQESSKREDDDGNGS
jgi:hypothetical protein